MKIIVLKISVSERKYGQRNRIEAIELGQSRNVTHFQHDTRMKNNTHIKGNSIELNLNQKPQVFFSSDMDRIRKTNGKVEDHSLPTVQI